MPRGINKVLVQDLVGFCACGRFSTEIALYLACPVCIVGQVARKLASLLVQLA